MSMQAVDVGAAMQHQVSRLAGASACPGSAAADVDLRTTRISAKPNPFAASFRQSEHHSSIDFMSSFAQVRARGHRNWVVVLRPNRGGIRSSLGKSARKALQLSPLDQAQERQ